MPQRQECPEMVTAYSCHDKVKRVFGNLIHNVPRRQRHCQEDRLTQDVKVKITYHYY